MMRNGFILVLTMVVLAAFVPALFAVEVQTQIIPILERERWWAGVISESHRMPFTTASQYEFNFVNDTAGNQGQPLLISDQGRYVWSENPFWFRFDKGTLHRRSESGTLQLSSMAINLLNCYDCSENPTALDLAVLQKGYLRLCG